LLSILMARAASSNAPCQKRLDECTASVAGWGMTTLSSISLFPCCCWTVLLCLREQIPNPVHQA
jgi:hypothetical protein